MISNYSLALPDEALFLARLCSDISEGAEKDEKDQRERGVSKPHHATEAAAAELSALLRHRFSLFVVVGVGNYVASAEQTHNFFLLLEKREESF